MLSPRRLPRRLQLVITGRNEKKLLAASKELVALATNDPIKVVAEVCDVREPYSVDALFDMVQTRFGRIDILVNNAGISQRAYTSRADFRRDVARDDRHQSQRHVSLHSRGVAADAAGGTIINNLSAAAKQVFPQFGAYTAVQNRRLWIYLVAARRNDAARYSRDRADDGRNLNRHVAEHPAGRIA